MNKIATQNENGTFSIVLNNPKKRNALDLEMMQEITQVLSELKTNLSDTKYVMISGLGKSFCAGADLNWMKEMVNYSLEENIKDSEHLYNLFYSIYSFPLPVLVKAHGHVFGGGLGLLAAADYVLAEKDTKFCFSEVHLGLAPAVISSFVLSKCNTSHAQALMTSGIGFTFDTAFQLGLVNAEATEQESLEVIGSYSRAGQSGMIASKKLCLDQRAVKPENFKDLTIKTISELRTSDEAQTRMKNFLDKK